MKVAAVIPARLQSTRLPRKPLLPIVGIPMILRVLERARVCADLDRVIVATDSEEIAQIVREGGGEAWMTSPRHHTGSDRVAEVAAQLPHDLILNLQGDEPLLPASTVERLVGFAHSHFTLPVVTAMVPLRREEEIVNPNIVKVVTARDGRALYFSRYPIPYRKAARLDMNADDSCVRAHDGFYKHVGIYLYRREFLLAYVRMVPTPLELSESLEQLRILEHGYPIYAVEVAEDSVSVDTPEDLARVEEMVRAGAQ